MRFKASILDDQQVITSLVPSMGEVQFWMDNEISWRLTHDDTDDVVGFHMEDSFVLWMTDLYDDAMSIVGVYFSCIRHRDILMKRVITEGRSRGKTILSIRNPTDQTLYDRDMWTAVTETRYTQMIRYRDTRCRWLMDLVEP